MNINLNLHLKKQFTLCTLIILFLNSLVMAQTISMPAKNKNPFPVKYISEIDKKLNLHTITLAPVYDNVKKIYAEPIQKLLIELLKNDKTWGYSPFPDMTKKIFVETYDTNPDEVLDILSKTSSQGLLTAIITKGPNGLSATLRLYTLDQGLLLAEESFQDLAAFEIPRLREEFITLYQNIKNKMPYRGLILSRRGLDVTLNAGSKNGLVAGQELTLAQVLKINRHPKLKYLVSTEKEIIGRIQLTKVEPYLSFAQIIFEKETGVVEVGAKILPTDSISYPRPIINLDGDVIGDKSVAPSLSKNTVNLPSKEQTSNQLPQYGKAILQGGFGQFAESGRFTSGTIVETSQSITPSLFLGAEFWMTPNWFVNFSLIQSIFKTENPLVNSNPINLNYTFSKYTGSIGYYFLMADDFWGPKFSAQVGYSSYKTDVTDTTPTAFNSTSTGGGLVKLTGSFPLKPEYPIDIGASFDILLSPTFSESPVSSGSASSRINSFGLFASYESSASLHYRFDLCFDQIQTDFNSAGLKRSSTIKMTTQLFGVEYLF